VVDRTSNAGIEAEVSAWSPATKWVKDANPCPLLDGELVDSTQSTGGEFQVGIPSDRSLYSVVYCSNDYHPAIMIHLRNGPSGSPTSPRPMRLQGISNDVVAIDATDLAIFALNQLAYLRSIDPESFDSAMGDYAELIAEIDGTSAEAFSSLSAVVASWATEF